MHVPFPLPHATQALFTTDAAQQWYRHMRPALHTLTSVSYFDKTGGSRNVMLVGRPAEACKMLHTVPGSIVVVVVVEMVVVVAVVEVVERPYQMVALEFLG